VSPPNALSPILDPLLSRLDEAANGSAAPCLPLGPAADSRGGR
jgi:phospholipid/cholesterol/gamma-HCH transport system substrate-binding protein